MRYVMDRMKWLGLLLFLIWQCNAVAAEDEMGRIQGVVQTSERTPLPNVNITIANTSLGTVSSSTGRFSFDNVPAGGYVLIARLVGYHSVEKEIKISTNTTARMTIMLTPETMALPPIVVTGTKSSRKVENAPIQTQVITKREIDASGVINLRGLLAEQTGLAVISDHGRGVQMQGFDPDYTLILLDGEPIIGRTAGTLDLDRFLVNNLEQVEIVKGPTSSLYGSEALAGVINLITRMPEKPFSISVRPRYGSFGSLNFTGELETHQRDIGISFFIDRSQSDGYDHTPETISPTAPEYVTYTANPKIVYRPNHRTTLSLAARVFVEDQNSLDEIYADGEIETIHSDARLTDWNINPKIVFQWTPGFQITGKFYTTRYHTKSELTYRNSGETYSASTFTQNYHKAEVQAQKLLGKTNLITMGAGSIWESVEADRITGGRQTAQNTFAFLQEEWLPTTWLNIVLSGRIDAHSDYATRLSPKAALLIKPIPSLRLRASIGSGFKAPTFQQLYLDFTNPSVGYSVLGSTYMREGLALLQREGRIAAVLQDVESLEQIRAESAVSYNGGIEIAPRRSISAKINFFHNNVQDLIESSPIARKMNGQSVYTYFNLNRVFTKGIESELTLNPFSGVTLSAGYQYLETGDREVLDKIEADQIVKIDTETNKLRHVEISEYGGLYNRSKHTATMRFFFHNEKLGFSGSLRGIYRGRYGYRDRNLNTILDAPEEYAPGYDLWHISLSQHIRKVATVQLGIDNIFDEKRLDYTPSLPGRTLYAGLTRSF